MVLCYCHCHLYFLISYKSTFSGKKQHKTPVPISPHLSCRVVLAFHKLATTNKKLGPNSSCSPTSRHDQRHDQHHDQHIPFNTRHQVCLLYVRSAGLLVTLGTLVSLGLMQASAAGFTYWLSHWTTHQAREGRSIDRSIHTYIAFTCCIN